MARPFSGQDHIEAARRLRDSAQTAQQLRQALAVLLPLECGLNLEQVAQVLGRSKGATCVMRTSFLSAQENPATTRRSKRQLRNRAKTSLQQEAQALDELLEHAAQGGVVVVPPLKPLLEKKLGKSLSLGTVYNMLHRHGWRKLAPDTVRPKGNPQVREDWKKTPRRLGANPTELCQVTTHSTHVSGRGAVWSH